MSELLLDAAGRRRSPATLPEFHAGRPPRNKGMRYPADPPTIEEIVTVMRHAGDGVHGRRLRGLIVVLWRAGLRIHEALALAEADLDPRRGSLLVRRGKGGRRREVGMDDWAWEAARALAPGARRAPGRTAVLRRQRRDAGTTVGGRRRTLRAAPRRPRGRRAATLCATPTAPRARRRDGPRGRAADRHPTPARPHQPRHHLGLPPRHRQHRDHRHRPLTSRADGPRPQLAASLKAQRDRPRGSRDFLAAGPRPDRQPGTRWRERLAECSIHREGAKHAG
jgi:integrase